MFEDDVDSDDDYDGYFLKPANEYNIIDKIKEANKELFSTPTISSSPIEFSDCSTGIGVGTQQRKVSFRENLVDYEPINDDNNSLTEIDEMATNNNNNNDDDNYSTRQSYLIDSDSLEIIKIDSSVQDDVVVENEKNQNYHQSKNNNGNNESVEDICEEIIELDLENNLKIINNNNDAQLKDENIQNMRNEKEMIPLRNSPPPRPINLNDDDNDDLLLDSEKNDDTNNLNNNDNDDEDDDDNLSLIVASYIRNIPNERFIDESNESDQVNSNSKGTKIQSIKRKMNPFKICRNGNKQQKNQININDNIMKLKLNYKTCCEYKNIENERLPKYTGYLSEYGLSKEQWDKREKLIETRRKQSFEKHLKVMENECKKNEDNERAFTNWLKNKMKFPINKTKNMFDHKPTTTLSTNRTKNNKNTLNKTKK